MSALYTIEWGGGKPSLADAAKRLDMSEDALDPRFGVVLIDPKRHLFAVRTMADVKQGERGNAPGVAGPHSDPRIRTFGLSRR